MTAALHGSSLPRAFVGAAGFTATAQYTSDGSINRAGFVARFDCIDPATVPPAPPDPCQRSGINLVDTGLIEHTELQAHQDCSWAMSCTDVSLSPYVRFVNFETEQNFDFLYIYDNSYGGRANRTYRAPAASLHGSALPIDFVSSGSSAVAQYTSDGSVHLAGI